MPRLPDTARARRRTRAESLTPYRHILVATDGSALSLPAIRMAARMAKALGAKLTGLTVVAPYFPQASGRKYATLRGFQRAVQKQARQALAAFSAEARSQGVAATAASVLGGMILGSETTKVLTHSRIPVLVCR